MLGCDGEAPTGYWRENLIDGRELLCCPMRTMRLAPVALRREVERHVHEYYPLYKDGHLLVAGGVADQPARYLDYMRTIGAVERVQQAKYDALTRDEGAGE